MVRQKNYPQASHIIVAVAAAVFLFVAMQATAADRVRIG